MTITYLITFRYIGRLNKGLDNEESWLDSHRGKRFFSSPEFPDQLWGPASLLFSHYLVPFEEVKVQNPINNFKKVIIYIVHIGLLSWFSVIKFMYYCM